MYDDRGHSRKRMPPGRLLVVYWGEQARGTRVQSSPCAPRSDAGFYDGDPRGLNHTALQSFSNMVDRSIVHPGTILGKVVQKNNDLLGCRGDPGASTPCFKGSKTDKGPVANFWTIASRAFVHGMAWKKQSSVVAVLNKGLDPTEEWSLYHSVFWNYDLQKLAEQVASSPTRYHPQLLLVDMRGTCEKLVRLVADRLEDQVFYIAPHTQYWLSIRSSASIVPKANVN